MSRKQRVIGDPHRSFGAESPAPPPAPPLNRWLPLALGLAVLLAGIVVWQLLIPFENDRVRLETEKTGASLTESIGARVRGQFNASLRQAERMSRPEINETDFQKDSRQYMRDFLGMLAIRYSVDGNPPMLAMRDGVSRPDLFNFVSAGVTSPVPTKNLPDYSETLTGPTRIGDWSVYFLTFYHTLPTGQRAELTTALDARPWLGQSLQAVGNFDAALLDNGEAIIDPQGVGDRISRWTRVLPIDAGGHQWRIFLTPTATLVQSSKSHLPEFVLIGASLFSFAIALATYLAMLARTRHLEATKATSKLEAQAQGRREAEQQRDEAHQDLGSILESITDGFIILDKDWRYVYANRVAANLSKCEPEDLVGRNIFEAFPDFGRSSDADQLRGAMLKRVSVSLERKGVDGRYYSLRAYPHREGLALYFHDISAQHETADKLRKSESLLRQAQSVANMGSFVRDTETNEERWSEELVELLRPKKDSDNETPLRFSDFVNPDDRVRLAEVEAQLHLDSGEKEINVRVIRSDGEVRTVAVRARLDQSGGGRAPTQISTVQDVTEHERAEANLAAALSQSRQQSAKFRALNRAMLLISAKLGHSDLHQVLVEELRETVRAHIGVLQLIGDEATAPVTSFSDKYLHWPHAVSTVNSMRLLAESGRGGKSLRLSRDDLVRNPIWSALNALPSDHAPLRGMLSVPLYDRRGALLGFLQASDRQEGEFTPDDEAVAVQFTQIASVAIGWARLIDDLRKTQVDLSHQLEEVGRSRSVLADAERVAKLGSWEVEPHARRQIKLSEEAARILESHSVTGLEVIATRVHADDIDLLRSLYAAMTRGETNDMEHDFRFRGSVAMKWLHLKARVSESEGGGGKRVVGIIQDVTQQRADMEQDRLNAVAFAGIAAGIPLEDSLTNVIALYESRFPDGICSILLSDSNRRLHTGSAPRLEHDYNAKIDGLLAGPSAGSCGTAVWRRERVIVTDTLSDPLWKDFADLAAKYQLLACWSTPILDPSRNVLGTFAVYYNEARAPQPQELECVDRAVSVAAIAIGAHQSRQQIEDREQRFRSLFTYVPEAVFALDMQGNIVDCNQAAVRMSGYSREELLHSPLAITVSPEVRNVLAAHIALAASGTPQQIELQRQRPDGTRYTTVSTKTPIIVDGALVGIFSIVRDVTSERANRFALEEALRTVRGHNRELEEFAFVASHDLQEPLRKVRAFGDRLRVHLGDTADTESLDYIERMRAAAERMQRLIDDLLAYSRVGKRERRAQKLELREVLAGVLTDMETTIEQRKAEVIYDDLPTVVGDETQWRQLLQNLISNALKFAYVGRVPVIKIHSEVFRPNEGFDRRSWVRIVVADNGIGFDNKYADRIFGAFQRLHGQGEYAGSGIGLAIVRRIVERHGGHVQASGVPGEGAKFTIEIPQSGADIGSMETIDESAEANVS